MLTGDQELVARSMSSELNLSEYHAGLLPEDKANIIKKYKKY